MRFSVLGFGGNGFSGRCFGFGSLRLLRTICGSRVERLTLGLLFRCHSDDVREKMKTRYLSNPDYNVEKVNRASMACGPMVKWAIAQVKI